MWRGACRSDRWVRCAESVARLSFSQPIGSARKHTGALGEWILCVLGVAYIRSACPKARTCRCYGRTLIWGGLLRQMKRPEDEEARTFVRALLAAVVVFAKPLFWIAVILAVLVLILAEPLS